MDLPPTGQFIHSPNFGYDILVVLKNGCTFLSLKRKVFNLHKSFCTFWKAHNSSFPKKQFGFCTKNICCIARMANTLYNDTQPGSSGSYIPSSQPSNDFSTSFIIIHWLNLKCFQTLVWKFITLAYGIRIFILNLLSSISHFIWISI